LNCSEIDKSVFRYGWNYLISLKELFKCYCSQCLIIVTVHTLGGFLDVGNEQFLLRILTRKRRVVRHSQPPSASNLANPATSLPPNAMTTSGSPAGSLPPDFFFLKEIGTMTKWNDPGGISIQRAKGEGNLVRIDEHIL
jgi:hypothetical protein